MTIALLQINFLVGDIAGNVRRIAERVRQAHVLGAELCVCSELAVSGYPPRDLLLTEDFAPRCVDALRALARDLLDGPAVLVGAPMPNERAKAQGGKPLANCAVLLQNGAIQDVFCKSLLPTYDIFDESRYFEPCDCPKRFVLNGKRIGVTICEDIWNDKDYWPSRLYSQDPLERLAAEGLDLLVNCSASPFSLGKQALRQDMLGRIAAKYALPVLYANQVGGADDLIFDGRSMAFNAQGALIGRARGFAEDILLVDPFAGKASRLNGPAIAEDDLCPESEAWRALILGLRDYAAKCGFKSALLGLSGGIDSALCATLAAEALGPDKVLAALMPSPYSSPGSIDDSLTLAANLGIKTLTLPIAPLMDAFDATLAPAFVGRTPDVAEENIQSRIRGALLMALSNKFGALLLTTGNKSELAVGYCTIYGDMSGGLALISDAPKTLVYALARWHNARQGPIIPQAILDKAPSAELKPNQQDSDSLPDYDTLDAILHRAIIKRQSAETIAAAGFDPATVARVLRLVKNAEFKRRQAAPGVKITDHAFGTGWRMPLAARW